MSARHRLYQLWFYMVFLSLNTESIIKPPTKKKKHIEKEVYDQFMYYISTVYKVNQM
jgi:hypothetical protein